MEVARSIRASTIGRAVVWELHYDEEPALLPLAPEWRDLDEDAVHEFDDAPAFAATVAERQRAA